MGSWRLTCACVSPSQLALDYGIKFMETSAKANINVENVSPRPTVPAPSGCGSSCPLQGDCHREWPQALGCPVGHLSKRHFLGRAVCEAQMALGEITPVF